MSYNVSSFPSSPVTPNSDLDAFIFIVYSTKNGWKWNFYKKYYLKFKIPEKKRRRQNLTSLLEWMCWTKYNNAVVTPLRKAASYEPRIAILGIWGDTWLTRGKYGIYVAVRGSYGALNGSTWRLLESGEKFQNVQNSAT